VEAQKTEVPIEMQTVKIKLIKFQMGTRAPLGHSCYILAKNLSTFCQCPETSNEAEFKSNGLINLMEEISVFRTIEH
jgi:hypothetical protein